MAIRVDQGLFAQRNTAPSCDGAALVGENHPDCNSAEIPGQSSNTTQILRTLKAFFKDNPTWE
jgi:hypothetical protein